MKPFELGLLLDMNLCRKVLDMQVRYVYFNLNEYYIFITVQLKVFTLADTLYCSNIFMPVYNKIILSMVTDIIN